jgi:predicted nuclease with TOPRIM domain
MNTVIIAVGTIVLIGLGIVIGVSTDTEAHRVHWREIAHERRERRGELAALEHERERLREQRRKLTEEVLWLRNQSANLCEQCPLWRFRP